MFIPPGFTNLFPYFFAQDAASFVQFLEQGLDGQEHHRVTRPDGKIANVMVQLGSSMVMVSEASPQYPPMPSSFYLYVEDADAAVARALSAGATLEMPVSDMPYQDRQGGVRDPHGNIWWISQRLVPGPYQN